MSDDKRLDELEKSVKELDAALETLAELMDSHSGRLQESITEVSNHFISILNNKVRRIVRDELSKVNDEHS